MKSTEELRGLYENQLKPALQSLENQRKKLVLKYMVYIFGIPVAFAISFFLIDQYSAILYLSLVLIIFFIYKLVRMGREKAEYRDGFKSNVVNEIVRMINPEWRYKPYSNISESDYQKSNLFPAHYDRYRGDDKVEGKIEKTDFQFSELHSEYKTRTTDGNGNTQEKWVTIFKGIFIHADFNKDIQGRTLVLPDTAEKLFGRFGRKLQAMSNRGELVKMEDTEFEKLFVVYGSDQIESRYVLTPTIMKTMVDIKRKYKKNVYFSFVGSRVYVAISFSKDLFEPRLLRSGVRFEDMEQMNEYFRIIHTIIHEMNLNTRIWTKN